MAALLGWLVALFLLGCALFVLLTYVLAFGPRLFRSRALWRAATQELITELALLPFYPLSLFLGSSYARRPAPQGTAPSVADRPVILLHGIAMNRSNWLLFGRRLVARGLGPLYGLSYYSPQSVRTSAKRLERFVERVCEREGARRVDIVAHSLGGIVARYYIERLGGAARVAHLVTLGSPHRGTALGKLGLGAAAQELRAGSELLAELGDRPEGVAYFSVWSRADAVIQPPESSHLPGAEHVLENLGHFSLLASRRVVEVVVARLQQGTLEAARAAVAPGPEPATQVADQPAEDEDFPSPPDPLTRP